MRYVKTQKHYLALARYVCYTYIEVLFCDLQVLIVAITSSTNNIKPILEFLSNALQHVAVHRVACSYYLIFHVIDIWRKWRSKNFFFNVSHKKRSHTVRCGNLAGEAKKARSLATLLPIHCSGSFSFG